MALLLDETGENLSLTTQLVTGSQPSSNSHLLRTAMTDAVLPNAAVSFFFCAPCQSGLFSSLAALTLVGMAARSKAAGPANFAGDDADLFDYLPEPGSCSGRCRRVAESASQPVLISLTDEITEQELALFEAHFGTFLDKLSTREEIEDRWDKSKQA